MTSQGILVLSVLTTSSCSRAGTLNLPVCCFDLLFNGAVTIKLTSNPDYQEYGLSSCLVLACVLSPVFDGARISLWLHLVATENRLGHSEPEGETEPCLLSNLSCVGWVGFSVLGVRPLHFLKWFSSAKKRCENVSTDIKSQEQDVAVLLKKGLSVACVWCLHFDIAPLIAFSES